MCHDLQMLEELKKLTASLVASQKRFNKLSERRREMSMDTHTQGRIQKAEADLNWHAMSHDQLFREVHAVAVDVGLAMPSDDYGEIEYNPSPFHKYSYQPRIPLCRRPRS